MRRALLLLALVWVPFLSIFVFAHPSVTGAVGDSYPHVAFHLVSPALLVTAAVLALRLRRDRPGERWARGVLGLLALTLAVTVLGNAIELLAAVRRLADDGWASRLTPDLFLSGAGLHGAGASLTIPAHMASMVLTLAVVALEGVRARRSPGGRPARTREAAARR